jgi:hypothetical protein
LLHVVALCEWWKKHIILEEMGRAFDDKNKRHWFIAVLMQIGIRIRYLFESWFGFRPIFMGISGYKSPFRPKKCPE